MYSQRVQASLLISGIDRGGEVQESRMSLLSIEKNQCEKNLVL